MWVFTAYQISPAIASAVSLLGLLLWSLVLIALIGVALPSGLIGTLLKLGTHRKKRTSNPFIPANSDVFEDLLIHWANNPHGLRPEKTNGRADLHNRQLG